MTDEEVRQQIERTDAFIAAFRELIASTVVVPRRRPRRCLAASRPRCCEATAGKRRLLLRRAQANNLIDPMPLLRNQAVTFEVGT